MGAADMERWDVQVRRGVVGRAVEMADEALFSPTLLRLP